MIIYTGGQSGADLGGNKFAKKYGIYTEINTHYDFKPVRGKIPDGIPVNIVSKKRGRDGLQERTVYNVTHTQGTLILIDRDDILQARS